MASGGLGAGFYAFDASGNTVLRINGATGAVTASTIYDAYGNAVAGSSTTTAGPFGYGGEWGYVTDAETGLTLCGHRYYDAVKGRWLNRDPIGYAGGLDLYGYAEDSPTGLADPLGLLTWSEVGSFGEGLAVGAAATAIVVIAAPEIATVGAAALVATGVEAATATSVASGVVTSGLGVSAIVGAVENVIDIEANANSSNSGNVIAYDVGALTGSLVAGGIGGRYVADRVSGHPSQVPPSWNPIGDNSMRYRPELGPPGPRWLSTGPTPQSGGLSAAATGTGAATVIRPHLPSGIGGNSNRSAASAGAPCR